ncbi:MAG: (d)CMP kinase, partial [Pseudomonadota bacterium]
MIIAIDGSTASGKGTLAKRVAARFGLPHMDTGLLYRATGAAAINAGVNLANEAACAQIAQNLDLDRFDPATLRTAAVGQAASKVAALPAVREALLNLQREFAGRPSGAVLDGRDIGTVICPDADIKLWIDADLDVRAQRRAAELTQMGASISAEDMARQLR